MTTTLNTASIQGSVADYLASVESLARQAGDREIYVDGVRYAVRRERYGNVSLVSC